MDRSGLDRGLAPGMSDTIIYLQTDSVFESLYAISGVKGGSQKDVKELRKGDNFDNFFLFDK